MATRTFSTGDDLEAALLFLAKESGVTSEQFFANKLTGLTSELLEEADKKRFALVKKLIDEKNPGKSIADLRELLGA